MPDTQQNPAKPPKKCRLGDRDSLATPRHPQLLGIQELVPPALGSTERHQDSVAKPCFWQFWSLKGRTGAGGGFWLQRESDGSGNAWAEAPVPRPLLLPGTHRAPADERVGVGILHQRPELGEERGDVAAADRIWLRSAQIFGPGYSVGSLPIADTPVSGHE